MIDRKELKARAKEFAFSHKMEIWKPFLVIAVISIVVSFVLSALFGKNQTLYSILDLAFTVAVMPMTFAAYQCVMKSVHGEKYDWVELFKNKYKLFVPILVLTILVGVLVGLGFMVLIVPGIILAIRYAMTEFIAAEAEEKFDAVETMRRSSKMMEGHKWEYFVLLLSFIGWMILGSFTLGIAYIWAMPYMIVTQVYYFDELKKLEK